jgi:two-component system, OmpR family, alkaline phosphatase synthesis response regulator PhoP
VLVIEDEADMMNLLRYNLSKAGFGVLIARDGLTGLELARKNRPDVVILDLLLPQMDGYAVCKAIRNNPATVALPIVILTAKAEPGERIKGLEIGADDYVTKPFNLRELILRVRSSPLILLSSFITPRLTLPGSIRSKSGSPKFSAI